MSDPIKAPGVLVAGAGAWWWALERRISERFGRPRRSGQLILRLPPILFLTSATLWALSATDFVPPSTEQMRHLTPWVGAAALLLQSLYLLRVLLRVTRLYHAQIERLGGHERLRRLRRVMLPVLNILLGVLIFAIIFCFQSLDAITDSSSVRVTRLLWALTMGGLMLGITLGELISRLLDLVDDLAENTPAAEQRSR